MKKPRFYDKMLLFFIALSLLLGGAALILLPAPAFSEAENRFLAPFPTISGKSVANGSFTAALDTYASERLPGRSFWRRSFAVCELLLGKREVHDVLLCRDGSLSRRPEVDATLFAQNLAVLGKLRTALPALNVAVVPYRLTARAEVLPAFYSPAGDREIYAALPADVLLFEGCTEDAQWFRTDHHWTADGAYFAYAALGEALGYTPLPLNAFEAHVASDSFLGSSEARAGLPGISADRLVLRLLGDEAQYRVLRDGKPAPFAGFYDMEKLSARDKYAVFLGGNCGTLEITKGDADTRPTLLVIRDSFASPLLPYLARHFRILAIDPRYAGTGVAALATRADRALLLSGIQTLAEGEFLLPLLKG